MKSKVEIELREIVGRFNKRVSNREWLISSLLELKEDKSLDISIATRGSLTPSAAKRKIKELSSKLKQCQKLIVELNVCLLHQKQPLNLRVIETNGSALTFVRPSPLPAYLRGADPSKIRGTDISMTWFLDVLETVKFFVENNSRALIIGQNTSANVQEIYLASAAIYCMSAGIKCSDSTGSQFFKIAKWFLGINDPRKTIRKSQKLLKSISS